MEKYTIKTVKEGNYLRLDYKEAISKEKNLLLGDIITDDPDKAYRTSMLSNINKTLTEISELFPFHFGIIANFERENKKIEFQDLNAPMSMKLCTEIIQNVDPFKFSEECEKILQENPETLQSYEVSTPLVRTQLGEAFMFMATVQYWANEDGYKQYKERLNGKSKIIV